MVVFSLLKRSFLHLVSVRAEVSGEKITACRRWTSPSLPIAYIVYTMYSIVYTMYSGFRMLWAEVGCVASDGNFSLCQLDTCKCVVSFFMYICNCSLMPFLYVLFVKILSYVEEIKNIYLPCADPESFVRGGPNMTTFFFSLVSGGWIQIPQLAGHQRPASETQFKWCFAGG